MTNPGSFVAGHLYRALNGGKDFDPKHPEFSDSLSLPLVAATLRSMTELILDRETLIEAAMKMTYWAEVAKGEIKVGGANEG